jgi:glyceraldehyde-3-phosphate dehydrogenase (NADP+)
MSIVERLLDAYPREGDIPSEYALAAPLEDRGYLLNGEILRWPGEMTRIDSTVAVRSGDRLAPVHLVYRPVLDEAAGLAAVAAADAAYGDGMGAWPTMGVAERIRHVREFIPRLEACRDDVVRLMMWEICKPLKEARDEFERTVEDIRDTVEALDGLHRASARFVEEKGIFAQIRRAPLGPVLCMGPYNYPLNETFATLIPALLMGNTAIVKTPRQGRLIFGPLLEAFRDCFPKGVVNVLHGDRRVVRPILQSGRISVLAFIGTSAVAASLRALHPHPNRLRCVLGLDAKNPAIVTESADMELAASEVLTGSLAFSGQRCTALKIVFVHESRLDEMLERLSRGIGRLTMGMPWIQGVNITPLPTHGKIEYLTELLDDARSRGAHVVNPDGGASVGALYHPALLSPVSGDMRVFHEEQFGPIVPVVPYRDAREPIEALVRSKYGQQVSVFSSDPEALARLIDPLVNQVCRVNVNSKCQRGPDTFPFTGRKDSAEGTLSVSDALRCFSIRTLVAAKGTEGNKALLNDIVGGGRSTFLSTDGSL